MPGVRRPMLVLPATRRDGEVCRALLTPAGIDARICDDARAAARLVGPDIGILLITDAVLADPGLPELHRALRDQPAWSDVPIVVMARMGESDLSSRLMREFSNILLLERPASARTLISAVEAALRARGRQFQVRQHVEAQMAAEAALRESDRRKDEFLATLAHELRHPIAPLRMGITLLRTRLMARGPGPGASTEALTRTLSMMDRQVELLAGLTGDLLDAAAVMGGELELQRQRVDLREVLRTALETASTPEEPEQDGSEPAIAGSARSWRVELPFEPVWMNADRRRLTQVAINLLAQAVQSTAAGGHITVTLRTPQGRAGSGTPQWACLEVADDGRGLDGPTRDRIFELFVMAPPPGAEDAVPSGMPDAEATAGRAAAETPRRRSRLGPGLGLGMALVQRLVHLHGGQVRVHSAGPGQGSRFTVDLPLEGAEAVAGAQGATGAGAPPTPDDFQADVPAQPKVAPLADLAADLPADPPAALAPVAEPAGIAERSPSPSAHLSPPSRPSAPDNPASLRPKAPPHEATPPSTPEPVLVIDDNEDAADTLAMFLQMMGHPCKVAYSAADGLTSAEAHEPAVVFCDMGMPGMSGLDFAAHIRRHPRLRRTRLVAVTGWGGAGDRERALQAGFDLHLTKPASPEALLAALRPQAAPVDDGRPGPATGVRPDAP